MMRTAMRMKGCQAIFLAVLLCIAARAQAGTVIQQEQRDIGSDQPGQQVTLYVDAGKLRIEGQDPKGEKSRGEKVGDFVCTVYEVLTQGQVSEVIWAAPAGQVQLDEADLKTFQALGEFYEPLRRQFPQSGMGVSAMRGVEGFPVRTVSYEGQRAVSEGTLVNIEQQSLDDGRVT